MTLTVMQQEIILFVAITDVMSNIIVFKAYTAENNCSSCKI